MSRRRYVGRNRFERLMHWLYFWLDLYGPDGRPSHHKVLSAWGFFLALAAEVVWGFKLVQVEGGLGISGAYVGLVLGTLAVPMGKGAFRAVAGGAQSYSSGPSYAPVYSPSYGALPSPDLMPPVTQGRPDDDA